jgi:hypothetical protein
LSCGRGAALVVITAWASKSTALRNVTRCIQRQGWATRPGGTSGLAAVSTAVGLWLATVLDRSALLGMMGVAGAIDVAYSLGGSRSQ